MLKEIKLSPEDKKILKEIKSEWKGKKNEFD